jgi:hypothetical protein
MLPRSGDPRLPLFRTRAATTTLDEVVVHHADALHEGVAGAGPDEPEAMSPEDLRHGDGRFAAREQLIDAAPRATHRFDHHIQIP